MKIEKMKEEANSSNWSKLCECIKAHTLRKRSWIRRNDKL